MTTPKVQYSHDEVVQAYNAWVASAKEVQGIELLTMTNYAPRMHAWETYCDLRDGLPVGTNQQRRHNQSVRLVSSQASIASECFP